MIACRCCNDTGEVAAATGEKRPCSRCRFTEFDVWADARRPERRPIAPKLVSSGPDRRA